MGVLKRKQRAVLQYLRYGVCTDGLYFLYVRSALRRDTDTLSAFTKNASKVVAVLHETVGGGRLGYAGGFGVYRHTLREFYAMKYRAGEFKVTIIWFTEKGIGKRSFRKYKDAVAWAERNIKTSEIAVRITGTLSAVDV